MNPILARRGRRVRRCVHMVGGLAGMMGAVVLGSRVGRFDSQGRPEPGFDGHSMTLVVIGTLTLWFGWFGFNPGSQGAIHGPTNLEVVGRTLVCTTLSGVWQQTQPIPSQCSAGSWS